MKRYTPIGGIGFRETPDGPFCLWDDVRKTQEGRVWPMSTYTRTHTEDGPRDHNGFPVKVGTVVYLPSGWTNDTPNPWRPASVVGLSFIGGRHYLELDGCDTYRLLASLVSVVQPYPPNTPAHGGASA